MDKSIVFTFGRFNPPTEGHQVLINEIVDHSIKYKSENLIFVSQTVDKDRNPLDWEFKINLLKLLSAKANFAQDIKIKTPFQALEKIAQDGYKNVTIFVGSDRYFEFQQSMSLYARDWGITNFEVKCSGSKRNDSETGIAGCSSSKARSAAISNNFVEFNKNIASAIPLELQQEIFLKIQNTSLIEVS